MSPAETSINAPFDVAELAKLGQKQVDAFIEMQRELCCLVEQANRNWVSRVELERDMTSELTTKLSSAKTFPDAAKAYQEWMNRQMETLSEDGRKFLADSHKFVASTTRLFSSGEQEERLAP